jgi:hypothetical protein
MPIAKKVHIGNISSLPKDAVFWRSQTYEERLTALEEIRVEYHRWRYNVEPRLQRICKIAQR